MTNKLLYKIQNLIYKFGSNISLGFHAHNNLQNALNNSLIAADFGISLIDSTMYGLGRGAGNLNTELIVLELNKRYKYEKYNIRPVLNYINKYIIWIPIIH